MQAQFARAHPLVDDSGVVDDYARAKIGTHAVGDDEDDDEDDEDEDSKMFIRQENIQVIYMLYEHTSVVFLCKRLIIN